MKCAVGPEFYPVFSGFDVSARFAQLVEHRIEYVGTRAAQRDVTAGCRRSRQESAGLDAVGHHAVLGAVQAAYAFDGDHVGARAPDYKDLLLKNELILHS